MNPIHLSPRENQVISRIAQGMTEERIAYELGISHRTVANHTRNIRLKCGCPSITSAMFVIVSLGLIQPENSEVAQNTELHIAE